MEARPNEKFGRDLRGICLVDTSLGVAADLQGTDLRKANLQGAHLKEADFTESRLRGVWE